MKSKIWWTMQSIQFMEYDMKLSFDVYTRNLENATEAYMKLDAVCKEIRIAIDFGGEEVLLTQEEATHLYIDLGYVLQELDGQFNIQ